MKKALIVGIDNYPNLSSLTGCVNDARAVSNVLERHSDGTKNFDIECKMVSHNSQQLDRKELKSLVQNLFKDNAEIALFYFAGHGSIDDCSGYLVTTNCRTGDEGLSMDDLLKIVNQSPAKNKIIILDCCHSGFAGNNTDSNNANLSDGTTILTASTQDQYSSETDGSGIFTSLMVEALNGGAANLLGDITPGSVYAYIDQSLGAWNQRPVFKTNIKSFISLRKSQPPIPLSDLIKLVTFFPNKNHCKLDPSFEPTSNCPNPQNTEKFSLLQKYNRVNLVVPENAEHMYFAAMESKSCKLTVLGEHYWNLINKNRI